MDIRDKFPPEYKCDDGHFVRSKAEMLIDNWLYKKGIIHAYEIDVDLPENPDEDMLCDWYLPMYDTYVEYFGRMDDKQYLNRARDKVQLYQDNDLSLWCIDDKDLERLNKTMTKDIAWIKKERSETSEPFFYRSDELDDLLSTRFCVKCKTNISRLPSNYRYCEDCFND